MQPVPLGSKKHKQWETFANHFFLDSHQVAKGSSGDWSPMITHFAIEPQNKDKKTNVNNTAEHNMCNNTPKTTQLNTPNDAVDARLKIDFIIDS